MVITSLHWASGRCHPPYRQPGHPSKSWRSLFCDCLCVVSCSVSSGKFWRQVLLKFGYRVDMPLTLAQQRPTLRHSAPASRVLSGACISHQSCAGPTCAAPAVPPSCLSHWRCCKDQRFGDHTTWYRTDWAQRAPHPRSAQHVPPASLAPQSPGPTSQPGVRCQKPLRAG